MSLLEAYQIPDGQGTSSSRLLTESMSIYNIQQPAIEGDAKLRAVDVTNSNGDFRHRHHPFRSASIVFFDEKHPR